MPSFADLIAQGSAHAWLFVPSAILLGALHGLEPGHSKTLMAAFIVAVRGTVTQALLLGLAATVSHTAVVWGIALGGTYLFRDVDADAAEPYFQLLSAAIIVAVGAWMIARVRRDDRPARAVRGHSHGHGHDHRDRHDHGHHHHGDDHRHHPDGHRHPHGPRQSGADGLPGSPIPGGAVASGDHQSAHERAHAEDIRHRFAGRSVTTPQIVLFGLTGGLIPCPAAITVLLLCLQLREVALGAVLVLCFSIGLAVTLVAVGVAAALSIRHVGRRAPWFDAIARRAPYASGLLIVAVGLYLGAHGWAGLSAVEQPAPAAVPADG